MGVNPVKVKLHVTMISAALTAMGGFFYAQYILFLDPPSVFSINISMQIALLSIIGGLGTAARADRRLAPDDAAGRHSQSVPRRRPAAFDLRDVLLIVVLIAPKGVLGTIAEWRRHR